MPPTSSSTPVCSNSARRVMASASWPLFTRRWMAAKIRPWIGSAKCSAAGTPPPARYARLLASRAPSSACSACVLEGGRRWERPSRGVSMLFIGQDTRPDRRGSRHRAQPVDGCGTGVIVTPGVSRRPRRATSGGMFRRCDVVAGQRHRAHPRVNWICQTMCPCGGTPARCRPGRTRTCGRTARRTGAASARRAANRRRQWRSVSA